MRDTESGHLTVGSLFSGIGGWDLGLERAGMRVLWQCEADSWCRGILARHWPGARCYDDVRAVDRDAPRVDVLCGGFPCQPVSVAGRGLAQADERWLWPEYARLVGELRPRYVLVENVPGLLGRGLGDVLGDLAALGYDAEWDCIPAAAVGAPHLRDRVWIVAYPDRQGPQGHRREHGLRPCGAQEPSRRGRGDEGAGPVADADGIGWDGRPRVFGAGWRRQLADCGRWEPEPGVDRVATGIPERVDRVRALGNALVPRLAEAIGRRVVAYEEGRLDAAA
jgi:DNA (cytosine-5)-methyltransferase 1